MKPNCYCHFDCINYGCCELDIECEECEKEQDCDYCTKYYCEILDDGALD